VLLAPHRKHVSTPLFHRDLLLFNTTCLSVYHTLK